jgi:hypothetical protein
MCCKRSRNTQSLHTQYAQLTGRLHQMNTKADALQYLTQARKVPKHWAMHQRSSQATERSAGKPMVQHAAMA